MQPPQVIPYAYPPLGNNALPHTMSTVHAYTSNGTFYSNGLLITPNYQPPRLFHSPTTPLHSDSDSAYFNNAQLVTQASDPSTLNSPLYILSDQSPISPASTTVYNTSVPLSCPPPGPSSRTSSSPVCDSPASLQPLNEEQYPPSPDPSPTTTTKSTRKGQRRIWNHALEKFLFTPEELSVFFNFRDYC